MSGFFSCLKLMKITFVIIKTLWYSVFKGGDNMKLLLNAGSYKIALPKQIIELVLKWKHMDEIEVIYEENRIILTKTKK